MPRASRLQTLSYWGRRRSFFGDLRIATSSYFCDIRYKAIAVSLDRGNVLVFLRVIAEGPAKRRNVAGEIAVFNEITAPHLFDQFILFQQAAGVLGKDKQNVEYSSGHRHLFAAAQTYPVRRINLKIAENVPVTVSGSPVFIAVSVFQIFSDFFPIIQTTPYWNSDTKPPAFEEPDYKPISPNQRWFWRLV
jgi:hypothetical protein